MKNKYDLMDVTFTIPVRVDSPERARNIETVVKYLNNYFHTNIIIGEESSAPILHNLTHFGCEYIHYQTNDPMMRRTHILNQLAKLATTDIIVNYDTDVILSLPQYINSAKLISAGGADMVYPYDGNFYAVEDQGDIDRFVSTLSIDAISSDKLRLIRSDSVGGAIFWNKASFISGGMENENFVSWGFEDDERLVRFKTLGYKIMRWPGILYHLHHPPSTNSATKHKFFNDNQKEYNTIKNMTKSELIDYMKDWQWLN